MINISVLGSAGAIPDSERDTTYLALKTRAFSALIDCGGSPVLKMQKVGIDPFELDAVIVTHRHPDHTYGIPSLLQSLGLMGRRKQLTIFGTQDVLELIHSLIHVFDLGDCLSQFPVDLRGIPSEPEWILLEHDDFTIWTTPVEHSVPTVAIRVRNNLSRKIMVYSADTGPCDRLVRFAHNSDILIHECSLPASQESRGHSSGRQAGKVAQLAHVKKLILVHLPAFSYDVGCLLEEARTEFKGKVELPGTLTCYSL